MGPERSSRSLSLTVIIEQQHEKFCPPIPFESSIGLPQEFAGVDQGSILIEQVHVLPNVGVRRVRQALVSEHTMFSPALKTRLALYLHSSTLCLADMTPRSVSFPRPFIISKTAGIVSISSCPAGVSSRIFFNSNSYRRRRGIGLLMKFFMSKRCASACRTHC